MLKEIIVPPYEVTHSLAQYHRIEKYILECEESIRLPLKQTKEMLVSMTIRKWKVEK